MKVDKKLLKDSQKFTSGMGAVGWAIIEMFARAGMPAKELQALLNQMEKYFPHPTDEDCNQILLVVEARLKQDKIKNKDIWY